MINRSLTVLFCDDVRQEVQNKFSLIGCYGPLMWISQFPSVLPKLCMLAQFCTPLSQPVRRVAIRIKKDGEVIAEQIAEQVGPSAETPAWATRQLVNALFVLSPFPIEAPCALLVEAETDDEEIVSGGVFRIDPFPSSDEVKAPH